MEGGGTEVGKGRTDEDRVRCRKEKDGKEGGGGRRPNQGLCLSNFIELSSCLVINEEWNAICFP